MNYTTAPQALHPDMMMETNVALQLKEAAAVADEAAAVIVAEREGRAAAEKEAAAVKAAKEAEKAEQERVDAIRNTLLSPKQGSVRTYLESRIEMIHAELKDVMNQRLSLVMATDVNPDDEDDFDVARNLAQWRFREQMSILKDRESFLESHLRTLTNDMLNLHLAFVPEALPDTKLYDNGWSAPRKRARR